MEHSGKGDPARSLALLWRTSERTSRKGKPDLSVDRIVRAGIEIADAEGLAALSMRRVAERLGVGTMSLYTYVPGKAELLDVMLDTVYGETARPQDVAGAGGPGSRSSPRRTGSCAAAIRGPCRSTPDARPWGPTSWRSTTTNLARSPIPA